MSTPLPPGTSIFGARDVNETTSSSAPPSGGNPWEQYFGPASHEIKTNAYDKYAYETYDLPEAYRGKQVFFAV